MNVSISVAHNDYRLLGTLTHLNLGSANPRVKLFSGTQPAPGGAETTVLATIVLTKPAGSIVSHAIVVEALSAYVLGSSTGVATWARFINGDGEWHTDCDVTALGGGGAVQLEDTLIYAGGKVSAVSMVLH